MNNVEFLIAMALGPVGLWYLYSKDIPKSFRRYSYCYFLWGCLIFQLFGILYLDSNRIFFEDYRTGIIAGSIGISVCSVWSICWFTCSIAPRLIVYFTQRCKNHKILKWKRKQSCAEDILREARVILLILSLLGVVYFWIN